MPRLALFGTTAFVLAGAEVFSGEFGEGELIQPFSWA